MSENLKAPFPYFGGKSRVADEVWLRFGDFPRYVEPFAGSLAVLLGAPKGNRYEVVNDLDGMITNFWRALKYAPEETAEWASYPLTELDVHARGRWLIGKRESLTEKLREDPDFYDAQAAGWWVYGQGSALGDGFAVSPENSICKMRGGGVTSKNNRESPSLVRDWFRQLSDRLRAVHIVNGSWERVLTPVYSFGTAPTAVFLDPPYDFGNMNYAVGGVGEVSSGVLDWCVENGNNPRLRIAFCGYQTDCVGLEGLGWELFRWKALGGYGNNSDGQGKANAPREVIWFSPHCLKPGGKLFNLSPTGVIY